MSCGDVALGSIHVVCFLSCVVVLSPATITSTMVVVIWFARDPLLGYGNGATRPQNAAEGKLSTRGTSFLYTRCHYFIIYVHIYREVFEKCRMTRIEKHNKPLLRSISFFFFFSLFSFFFYIFRFCFIAHFQVFSLSLHFSVSLFCFHSSSFSFSVSLLFQNLSYSFSFLSPSVNSWFLLMSGRQSITHAKNDPRHSDPEMGPLCRD